MDSSCASGVTEEVLGVQRRDVLCQREVVTAVFLEVVSHAAGLKGGWEVVDQALPWSKGRKVVGHL